MNRVNITSHVNAVEEIGKPYTNAEKLEIYKYNAEPSLLLPSFTSVLDEMGFVKLHDGSYAYSWDVIYKGVITVNVSKYLVTIHCDNGFVSNTMKSSGKLYYSKTEPFHITLLSNINMIIKLYLNQIEEQLANNTYKSVKLDTNENIKNIIDEFNSVRNVVVLSSK